MRVRQCLTKRYYVLMMFRISSSIWIWNVNLLLQRGSGIRSSNQFEIGFRCRGIHCVSNSDAPTPLQELITPTPTPVLKLDMKKHSTTFPVLTVVLAVVVLFVFCALIMYSCSLLKQKRLRDNRIILSQPYAMPNYGTFNCFPVCNTIDIEGSRVPIGWTNFHCPHAQGKKRMTVRSSHSLSRGIVYGIVVVTLCMASGEYSCVL